jgi:putative peptidoglycan lipid II flippase
MTLAVKVGSAAKEIAVSYRFGTTDALDAYFIAWLMPSIAVNIAAGSFNSALLPVYVRVRTRDGEAAAQRLLSNCMTTSLGILAGVSLTLLCIAQMILPKVAAGFSEEQLQRTLTLFYILLPVLPAAGISSIAGAVLNTRGKFALMALAPLVTPILMAVGALVAAPQVGVTALAIAQTVGSVIEALILVSAIGRRGISLRPRWHGLDSDTRTVMNQYAPMAAAGALAAGTTMIDQAFASRLGSGAVSVLNYALRVPSLTLSVAAGLWTAVFPTYADLVARNKLTELRLSLGRWSRGVAFGGIAIVTLLIVGSPLLVELMFQRGAFSPTDTSEVTTVQVCYLLQVPLVILVMLFLRVLSALGANRWLFIVACVNLTLDIVLDLALMPRFGVAGIALASVLVTTAQLTMLVAYFQRIARSHQAQ